MKTMDWKTPELVRENLALRSRLKNRKRVVVKVGSSSLLHSGTKRLDYHRIDTLARELSDLKNRGMDVILVSSGATAAGREALNRDMDVLSQESPITVKQACAAIGQARLIMIYQKFFEDYNQMTAQVLMTKNTVTNPKSKLNLKNTFNELLALNVIPIVNENDSIATDEYSVGDNDSLSAMVASIMKADLLILLSDVDGLYTDDPRTNKDAEFIEYVPRLNDAVMAMGKASTGSGAGTGGMSTKMHAALMATSAGCDMVIVNTAGGMSVIDDVISGRNVGTLFRADYSEKFSLEDYIRTFDT